VEFGVEDHDTAFNVYHGLDQVPKHAGRHLP
jgi:hypothetical protein